MVNPSRGMVISQSVDHMNVKESKVSQVLVLAPVVVCSPPHSITRPGLRLTDWCRMRGSDMSATALYDPGCGNTKLPKYASAVLR